MEELFQVKLTIGELNTIQNIIGVVISRGKYEKGNWNDETIREVRSLLDKVSNAQDEAIGKAYRYKSM